MKQTIKGTNVLVISLGLSLAAGSSILFAQAQNQEPKTQQQDQQKSQTFAGKIVKARNGQFALLTDEQAGRGIYLDDQDKAKQFEGKTVKVTGTLEVAKNLLHVTDIQAA